MLWIWPDLPHALMRASSLATQAKVVLGVLTEIVMGLLALAWLLRLRHRARASSA